MSYPLEDQFYIGFYNKSLFTKAGITQVPQNWTQLMTDCALFKAMGTNCLYYGADTQALGAEFYPYYDLSYLMIGALGVSQWEELYNGQLSWTDPTVEAQLTKWAALHADGYTNSNVISSGDSLIALEKGQTAMIVDGNWDTAALYQSMGSNLGTFVPPYSDTSINGVVQFPGDGYSMTTYSQHKTQAAEFLQFLTTSQAATIIDQSGLIPDLSGSTSSNPVNQDMLNFAAQDGMTPYPMLDNVTQVGVVNEGSKVLPQLLAGQISVATAAQDLEQAWQALPAGQRSSTWASYKASVPPEGLGGAAAAAARPAQPAGLRNVNRRRWAAATAGREMNRPPLTWEAEEARWHRQRSRRSGSGPRCARAGSAAAGRPGSHASGRAPASC